MTKQQLTERLHRNQAAFAPASISQNANPALKVAYIMSRFPKVTETFVLYEILALESFGVRAEIYPLLREHQPIAHPEAERLVARAHFHPFFSLPILRAQWHFICRRPRAYFSTLFEALRSTWGSANFFLGALVFFPKAVRFAYEMAREGIQHVHAHFVNHPALAALIIHRLTGIPFSFTAHGSDIHVERRMLDRKIRAAAFVVSISEYNKELMARESGDEARDRIQVIHCGVDPQVFAPRGEKSGDGLFQIACVGSLEAVKGHKYLIDACRILIERGVDFVCHLVGDGPLRNEIESQIERSGLKNRICLHGMLPRYAVARLLSEADVTALSSIWTQDGRREGIPVVLMEAMASGLPVVASNMSGMPELVESGRTGILVPQRDCVALADALHWLARDRLLRRRMGMAGREKVLREFNLFVNAQKLLELMVTTLPRRTALDVGRPSCERQENINVG